MVLQSKRVFLQGEEQNELFIHYVKKLNISEVKSVAGNAHATYTGLPIEW